jgi:hypothetical protein
MLMNFFFWTKEFCVSVIVFSEVCFIYRAILHNQAVIRACLKEKQNIHFVSFLKIIFEIN